MSEPYVLVFPWRFPSQVPSEVILIEKKQPVWMEGKLNLPGGKVEKGETYEKAALRELEEETGIQGMDCIHVGKYPGVMDIVVVKYMAQQPEQKEEEKVLQMSINEALAHPKLMSNLKVMIPLIMARQTGWEILDINGNEIKVKVCP